MRGCNLSAPAHSTTHTHSSLAWLGEHDSTPLRVYGRAGREGVVCLHYLGVASWPHVGGACYHGDGRGNGLCVGPKRGIRWLLASGSLTRHLCVCVHVLYNVYVCV